MTAEIIDIEELKKRRNTYYSNDEVHYHMPDKFWTCSCEHCLFYIVPVGDTYNFTCYGCGKVQEFPEC